MSEKVIVTGQSTDWVHNILTLCGVPDSEQGKVVSFDLTFGVDEVAKIRMEQVVLVDADK